MVCVDYYCMLPAFLDAQLDEGADLCLPTPDMRQYRTRRSAQEAQALESQARRLLAASREAEAGCQRALASQLRRVAALEGMRLADLQVNHVASRMKKGCLIRDIVWFHGLNALVA